MRPGELSTGVPALPPRAAAIALFGLADAALAGLAVAALEIAVLFVRGQPAAPAATALAVLGLVVIGVALTGAPLVLLARLVARLPVVQSFRQRVATPGSDRVIALVTLAAVLGALGALWGLDFAVARFAHGRFNSSAGAALVIASFGLASQVVVALAAMAIAPALGGWLARQRWTHSATAGRPLAIGLGLSLLTAAVLGHLALRSRFHSWDPLPTYVYVAGGLAVIAAAVLRPAEHLGRRRLILVMGLVVALLAGAAVAIDRVPQARGAVIASGTVSQGALRSLLRLADRDGDGFAGLLGGADCDDADPAIHPLAREIAGNRRDDNCRGGDLIAVPPAPATSATAPVAGARPDILLVSIDSLRADHTSAYGYRRPTTPTLAQLAARGARFTRAVTPSPTTRRALPALLSGRYASAPGGPTLASLLSSSGYRTHAILGVGGMLAPEDLAGIDDIESLVVYSRGYRRPDNAAEVTDRALAWTARQDAPWLLWLHYFDPHHPYAVPAGAPRFGDRDVDRYHAEIAHVDAQLGRLLAALAASPRGARTVVVVTADHGEAFGDHGEHFHGKNLYDDQIRVPLVIAAGAAPQVVATPVSLVDIAPTLLDLAGIAAPATMNGRSLVAAVRGTGPAPDRPILAELIRDAFVDRHMLAVVRGDHKLIWDLEANAIEAYDLARDPGEQRDRAVELGAELRAVLDAAADRELAAR